MKSEKKLLDLTAYFFEQNGEYENTIQTSKGRIKITIEEIKM